MSWTRSSYNIVGKKRVWHVRETVVSQDQYDPGPFDFGAEYEGAEYEDGTLNRVIDSLLSIREMIPEQYRGSASCSITSIGSWEDSHYANIEVSFKRPETPEETAEREENERRAEALQIAKDREQLAKLKEQLAKLKAKLGES